MAWEDITSGEEARRDDPMLREHLTTYHDFIKLVGCSAAAAAFTLIVLAILLL